MRIGGRFPVAEVTIANHQTRLHSSREFKDSRWMPFAHTLRNIAAKGEIVIPPNANRVASFQHLRDFHDAVVDGESVAGVANGDDLIDTAFAEKRERLREFRGVIVNVGDEAEAQFV